MSQSIRIRRKTSLILRNGRRRKGAAIILAVFLMGVLVSMLALSIDIGYIAASKAEARRTADAAALAGAWQIVDSVQKNRSSNDLIADVNNSTINMASLN